MDKPFTIMLTKDHDYLAIDKGDDDDIQMGGGKGAGASDQVLYSLLKDEV